MLNALGSATSARVVKACFFKTAELSKLKDPRSKLRGIDPLWIENRRLWYRLLIDSAEVRQAAKNTI